MRAVAVAAGAAVLVLALTAFRSSARPAVPGARGPALVDALRRGGFVIYFRHAATDFSQTDREPVDYADCSRQRNLNARGRSDARAIGAAIRRLRVPIDVVLSSRFCRTRQTAQLAFGRVRPWTDLTSLRIAGSDVEERRRIHALRRLLATGRATTDASRSSPACSRERGPS